MKRKKRRAKVAGEERLPAVLAAESVGDVEQKGKVEVNWMLDAGRCGRGAPWRCQSGASWVAHARGRETNVSRHLTRLHMVAQAFKQYRRQSTGYLPRALSSRFLYSVEGMRRTYVSVVEPP